MSRNGFGGAAGPDRHPRHKTGIVYTLDRATGEFLWARPTVARNVVGGIDGATGAASENQEVVFRQEGQGDGRLRV